MSSVDRLTKLANRLDRKMSLAQAEQYQDAASFFFGDSANLKRFQDALGVLTVNGPEVTGDKSLAKILSDYWNRTGQSVAVIVNAEAAPGKYARWIVNISPQDLTEPAMAELNAQYQAVTGRTWDQGQSDADKTAKQATGVSGDFIKMIVDKRI